MHLTICCDKGHPLKRPMPGPKVLLPLKTSQDFKGRYIVVDKFDRTIAFTAEGALPFRKEAAHLIVRAVNSHEELLETLAKVLRWINVGMDGIGEIYNLKDDIEKTITKSGGLT